MNLKIIFHDVHLKSYISGLNYRTDKKQVR